MTMMDRKAFFRLKAAMHDLIDRAGGIDRAAEICGYSRSAVGRWHCRTAEDLMPISAICVLEADTGAALVTRAMAALNGLECTASGGADTHVMGAYVEHTARAAVLNSTMADAMSDGVLTPGEITKIDAAAGASSEATEKLRQTLAAASGRPLKVVG